MASSAPKLKQSLLHSFLKLTSTPTPNPTQEAIPAPPLASASPPDYELLRQHNIRRNQEFLRKLGVCPPNQPRPPKRQPKPSPNPAPTPPLPLRRSARKRPPPPPADDRDAEDPRESTGSHFVDSSVFRYACDALLSNEESSVRPHCTNPWSLPSSSSYSSSVVGFAVVGKAFRDPSLTKIYSVDVRFVEGERVLVAAGGHGGFISVYGGSIQGEDGSEGERETEAPLMSWKGSQSWVSGVAFVEDVPMLLISSSNDGKLVVWDVKRQPAASSSRLPPVVAEAVGLHGSGIFSMDHSGCSIATASKDSSVGISRIMMAGELVKERNISGHHAGVIRGVCFRDDKDTLVDCGADGHICILDTRLPDSCALTIKSQHSTGVNTVEWCPSNKSLLLSSSKDPALLLYDIRSFAEPVHTLQGHVEPNARACHQIYRPSFIDDGKMIATPGQGSRKISIYSVHDGKLISQGLLGYDANIIKCSKDVATHPRLWSAGRQINQLCPMLQP